MSWTIPFSAVSNAAHTTICLYGPSQSGKTTQLGVLAEDEFRRTQRVTRLYTADPGGAVSLTPYFKLGVIEPVNLKGIPRPWEWLDKIVQGMLPEMTPSGVRWQLDAERNGRVGVWAYDSGTGIGDELMLDQSAKAAMGVHLGGQRPNFQVREGDVSVTGYAPAHYGNAQTVLAQKIKQSFLLPGTVVWTFTARAGKDEDGQGTPTFIGPQLVGNALTPEIPRWFLYTFRLVTIPANAALEVSEEHRLYLKPCADATTGAAGAVLTNNRAPLDAASAVPAYISPASVVEALALLKKAEAEAEAAIAARLGITAPGTQEHTSAA